MKTFYIFLFFMSFFGDIKADTIILKLNPQLLTVPKASNKPINASISTISNAYIIRRDLDPSNNILYSDMGLEVDTLNKDTPWKLVFIRPSNNSIVYAPDGAMSIDVLASSQTGILNTITPAIVGQVFLLGNIIEYRVVKVAMQLADKTSVCYGAFNINYRVVRNDTGDHWYPSGSFSFKAPGSWGDSTCVLSMAFTPPKISFPVSYWTNVNRTLIISK